MEMMDVKAWISKMPLTLRVVGTLRAMVLSAKWTEWWERGAMEMLRALNWDLRDEI